MGKFKYLYARLYYIESYVRQAYVYFDKMRKNPTLENYIKFKTSVAEFMEAHAYTKYEGVNYYDYEFKMYKEIDHDFNHGIYRIPFIKFRRKLKKEGIDLNILMKFSIPEYDKKLEFIKAPFSEGGYYRLKESIKDKTKKDEQENIEEVQNITEIVDNDNTIEEDEIEL